MLRVLPATLVILLLTAAPALAVGSIDSHDQGQGWYGITTDKTVTDAGFILIAAFPAFIFLASMLQGRLDKRKTERKAAAKARAGNRQWQGGW